MAACFPGRRNITIGSPADIPLKYLSLECWHKIAEVLDIPGPKDYKVFTQKIDSTYFGCSLGIGIEYLNVLQHRNIQSPTIDVLYLLVKQGVTIEMVVETLHSMNLEVADTVRLYMPDAACRYHANRIPQQSNGQPGRCNCPPCQRNWSISQPSTPSQEVASQHHQRILQYSNIPVPNPNLVRESQHFPNANNTPQQQNDLSREDHVSHNQAFDPELETVFSRLQFSNGYPSESHAGNTPHQWILPDGYIESSDVQSNTGNNCNCQHCESMRLSKDSDETEVKTVAGDEEIECTNSSHNNGELPRHESSISELWTGSIPLQDMGYDKGGCNHEQIVAQPHVKRRQPSKASHRNAPAVHEQPVPDDNKRYSDPTDSRSSSGASASSGSNGNLPRQSSMECTCHLYRSISERDDRLQVFISYADHSEEHLKQVLGIASDLKFNQGYRVRIDVSERDLVERLSQQSQQSFSHQTESFGNTNMWLREQFNKSNYIIFCITETYLKYTEFEDENNEDAYPSENHLHTKFLYNEAFTEFINNKCYNRRFLPVLFPGVRHNEMPSPFSSTKVFPYQQPMAELYRFITMHHQHHQENAH